VGSPKTLVAWLVTGAWLSFRWRTIAWTAYPGGQQLRLFAFALALPLVWSVAGAELNLYYGHAWVIERLVLVSFTLLLLWHPAFLPGFLWLLLMFWAQARYLIDSYTFAWFERMLPTQLLFLLAAWCGVRTIRSVSASVYPILALALTGADYAASAFAKLQLGPELLSWVLENRVHNLFVSSWINGWLSQLTEPEMLRVAGLMARVDVPGQAVVVMLEIVGLVLLFGRRVTLLLIPGFAIMHVATFVSSGIFFWKWIWADIALFTLLLSWPGGLQNVFRKDVRWASILVIAV